MGREDNSAAPLLTTKSTTHPSIPGWVRQVPINRPAHHIGDGKSQIETILRSSLGVHHQPMNTRTIQVARRVTPFLGYVYSMHAVAIRDAQNHGLAVDGIGTVVLQM